MPKKRYDYDIEKEFDKILDNYSNFKEFTNKITESNQKIYNTSKNFIWGYPKKNPNVPKKYYSKKCKK